MSYDDVMRGLAQDRQRDLEQAMQRARRRRPSRSGADRRLPRALARLVRR